MEPQQGQTRSGSPSYHTLYVAKHFPRTYVCTTRRSLKAAVALAERSKNGHMYHHNRQPAALQNVCLCDAGRFACWTTLAPRGITSGMYVNTYLGQRTERRKRRGEVCLLRVEVEVADDEALLLLLSHIWSTGVRRRRRRQRQRSSGGLLQDLVATCAVVYRTRVSRTGTNLVKLPITNAVVCMPTLCCAVRYLRSQRSATRKERVAAARD